MRALSLIGFFLISVFAETKEVDLKHLRCLVCRATMKELEAKVSKADPNKLVEIGSYRMDAEGNTIHKKVPLSRSEVYISDMLDNICEKMTDYVRAIRKSNNQLTILNLMSPSGGMNPLMSKVDVIQDGDLNKSLEHYCSSIIEEFEDNIVSLYVDGVDNKKEKLCIDISNICNENYIDNDEEDDNNNTDTDYTMSSTEEFTFEDRDEL